MSSDSLNILENAPAEPFYETLNTQSKLPSDYCAPNPQSVNEALENYENVIFQMLPRGRFFHLAPVDVAVPFGDVDAMHLMTMRCLAVEMLGIGVLETRREGGCFQIGRAHV